jgi:hypothetical protein
MELVLVKITDPINWFDRCNWIEDNCVMYKDNTSWAGWQIGFSDIEFYIPERDAIMYYLIWG